MSILIYALGHRQAAAGCRARLRYNVEDPAR